MTERYTLEDHEAYVEAEQKRKAQEKQQRQERSEKESAKKAWLADGGKEADFEREWPGFRSEVRKQRVMDADQRARENQRAAGVSKI
jgi:hypothetical protein